MSRPLYRLPEKTDKALRQFISKNNNGEFRKGMIMNELVKAVEYWIATKKVRSNTHTHAQNENLDCPKKIQKFRNKIIEYLEAKYGYDDLAKLYEKKRKYVNINHLKDAISYVKGTDPRTIDQGFKDLKNNRLIRDNGGNAGVTFDFKPFEGEEVRMLQQQPPKEKQIDAAKEFDDVIKGYTNQT